MTDEFAEGEDIVVKVGRCCLNPSTWNPTGKGVVLALSSKARLFIIPSCNIGKGLQKSTFFPFVGHYQAIKEIKEQDKLLETLSIEKCEKMAERIIIKEEIKEVKIEKHWGVKGYILFLNTSEKLSFGTLDIENMQKLFEKVKM